MGPLGAHRPLLILIFHKLIIPIFILQKFAQNAEKVELKRGRYFTLISTPLPFLYLVGLKQGRYFTLISAPTPAVNKVVFTLISAPTLGVISGTETR